MYVCVTAATSPDGRAHIVGVVYVAQIISTKEFQKMPEHAAYCATEYFAASKKYKYQYVTCIPMGEEKVCSANSIA
jgi:hypothetical protein